METCRACRKAAGSGNNTFPSVNLDVFLVSDIYFYFCSIFEIEPDAIALFPKFRDVPPEKREEDSAFRDHALKVVEAIGLAVSFLGDTDTLETVLQDLGSVHVRHGIQDVHFEVYECVL